MPLIIEQTLNFVQKLNYLEIDNLAPIMNLITCYIEKYFSQISKELLKHKINKNVFLRKYEIKDTLCVLKNCCENYYEASEKNKITMDEIMCYFKEKIIDEIMCYFKEKIIELPYDERIINTFMTIIMVLSIGVLIKQLIM